MAARVWMQSNAYMESVSDLKFWDSSLLCIYAPGNARVEGSVQISQVIFVSNSRAWWKSNLLYPSWRLTNITQPAFWFWCTSSSAELAFVELELLERSCCIWPHNEIYGCVSMRLLWWVQILYWKDSNCYTLSTKERQSVFCSLKIGIYSTHSNLWESPQSPLENSIQVQLGRWRMNMIEKFGVMPLNKRC